MYQVHFFDSNGRLMRVSIQIFDSAKDADYYGSNCEYFQRSLPKRSRFNYYLVVKLVHV